jgi:hypothetical protein
MGEHKHRHRAALAPAYWGEAIAEDPFLKLNLSHISDY